MVNLKDACPEIHEIGCFSFADFHDDIQLCILSFLSPTEIANFACTSKRFVSLSEKNSKVWYAMCDRRWGNKTQIKKWGNGKISYKVLYNTLAEYDNLIGFWRRCGQTAASPASPSLIFFEWSQSFLVGSRVSPSHNGSYQVNKMPFLWMGISQGEQLVNFLDLDGETELSKDFEDCFKFGILDNSNIVPVNVNFMGSGHVLVEETLNVPYSPPKEKRNRFRRSNSSASLRGSEREIVIGGSPRSLPENSLSEMYMQLANKTSPGGDRASRRQRKKEKEMQAMRKWEPEHFVKVVHCSPTPTKPLQGLWKGISDDMNLIFYLVTYDEIGGITCRTVGDLSSYHPLVFWISNLTTIQPPFSTDEEFVYDGRVHVSPLTAPQTLTHCRQALSEIDAVSHVLHIESSSDSVGIYADSPNREGRVWLYKNGTFGFGFLGDHFVIDLEHMIQDGCLLDTV